MPDVVFTPTVGTQTVCADAPLTARLLGLTTRAMQTAMTAMIATKSNGLSKTRFNETGVTGISVGPATPGEGVLIVSGPNVEVL